MREYMCEGKRTSNDCMGVITEDGSNYFKECIPYDYLPNLFLKPNMERRGRRYFLLYKMGP